MSSEASHSSLGTRPLGQQLLHVVQERSVDSASKLGFSYAYNVKSSKPEWANPTMYQHWKSGSNIQITAIFGLVSDFCVLRELKIAIQ